MPPERQRPLPESRGIDAATTSARSAGLDVLLVEDHALNQQLAQLLLTRWGHRVCIASNGVQALQRHAETHFDVILMDVQMPEMDGLEATAAIRARERSGARASIIIAMTASDMDGDRTRCLEAGMDDFLAKPFCAQAFRDVMARYAAGPAPASASAVESPVSWRAALPAPEQVDSCFDYAGAIAHADAFTVGAIGRQFAEALPGQLAALRAAHASGDIDDLRRKAHSLAGLFASFGATPAALAAQVIDRAHRDAGTGLLDALERECTPFRAALVQCADSSLQRN